MAKRVWPLVLVAGGIVLLLGNFLLLDFDLARYWPLIIVVLGVQLLIQGDIGPGWQAHTFGITRGSVQSASIEIESGELDVQVRALRKPGRLIAGQYTARSRPGLLVRNNHATLRLQRGQTWWLSLADWDLGLAHDLPWELLISNYLGRIEVDLRGINIDRAFLSSGLGSITLACSDHAAGPILARSTFGDVRINVPPTTNALIKIHASPFGRMRIDPMRFEEIEPGVYLSADSDPDMIDVALTVSSVFGSIYIT